MVDWRRIALGAYRGATTGPTVTYGTIAICCAIFLVSPVSGMNPGYGTGETLLAAQSAYFERWGVIPAELMSPASASATTATTATTPFTALFVHGNWLHLLGNVLFLYVFGAMAEGRMGQFEFTLFYLGTGYLALLAYAAVNADSGQTLVGASGAISGVLGAFLFLFPRARVTSLFPFLFFLPLRFPAWMVLIFWFVLQWLAATGAGTGGAGVAYLAHLVGFGVGFLYAWGRFRQRARVKVPAAATEGESQP
ncbi:rhomboid family intramembrane serine protease [Streptomyces sp. NPDC020965]|uniref:rhomboid family intramembrane serine protease n=1 Tax=Streptomyces sp. NPDC020965 TaxID=3365105 RepID=UPI0037B88212